MFAKKIVAALESAGVGLWIDDQELKAGDSLLDRIQSAIDRANFFMILLSPNSVASRWVQEELKFAMTRQLKGIDRFVIPLVVEPCDIPPFLQDRVYVDFTNKRRFKSNAAKLLHAIDQASGDGSDVDSVNYPDKTILDKLAADSELAADEWFETYKELPLVQDCLEAVNNGSFGGHFRQNLRAAITFASNQEGGIHFNNLLAMLGFTRDVGGLIPQRHDLQVLFREIIEDVSIGTDYRWFLFSFFLETLDDVDARSDRLGRIPKLFPHIGTDRSLLKSLKLAKTKGPNSVG
jgi:hypothetical protein